MGQIFNLANFIQNLEAKNIRHSVLRFDGSKSIYLRFYLSILFGVGNEVDNYLTGAFILAAD
jgi:hypothetical protein